MPCKFLSNFLGNRQIASQCGYIILNSGQQCGSSISFTSVPVFKITSQSAEVAFHVVFICVSLMANVITILSHVSFEFLQIPYLFELSITVY